MPSLTPSIRTVLDRVREAEPIFTAAEIALIEPVARAIAPIVPADARNLRQSIGALAASLPSQATDEIAGKLKLNTYSSMLDGVDQAALAYACRRCLEELDWFPTIRQLKERIAAYVSPEQHAINLARYIMRAGRRAPVEAAPVPPLTDEEIRRLKPEFRGYGLACGALTQEQIDRALAAGAHQQEAA